MLIVIILTLLEEFSRNMVTPFFMESSLGVFPLYV